MRVLLVTHYYPPEIGAPQRRWNAFVKEWRRVGVDVTVVTPLPHYPNGRLVPGASHRLFQRQLGRHGESIIRVPFMVGAQSSLAKLIDQSVAAACSIPAAIGHPYDVVVTTVPGLPSLVAGLLLARTRKVPHIVEMRDAWPDLISHAGLSTGKRTLALQQFVTRIQERADHVVTVSEDFAAVLRERLSRDSVTSISNGVDVENVPVLLDDVSIRGPIQALYLGTVGVSQALDSVLRAVSLAGPDVVNFRVIGGGSEARTLRSLAKELGIEVTFENQVSGRSLWEAYRDADTIVASLRAWPAFEYTVPSKLYEIFATGKHVSASLAGEGARLIDQAKAGVCVSPESPRELATAWEVMRSNGTLAGLEPGASREWVSNNADYGVLASRYLNVIETTRRRASA